MIICIWNQNNQLSLNHLDILLLHTIMFLSLKIKVASKFMKVQVLINSEVSKGGLEMSRS